MGKQKIGIITIPEEIKDESTKLKFCYIALRNMLYYVKKGIQTYTKHNRNTTNSTIKQFISSYIKCCQDQNVFTDCELDKLKQLFITENTAVIPKNEYIFIVEKELGFKNFAFYCNCITELSFHIDNDYFNDEYIRDTIIEFSEKSMIGINDNFLQFIVEDVNQLLEQLR